MAKKMFIVLVLLGLPAIGLAGHGLVTAQGAGERQEASTTYAIVDTGQELCYDESDVIACPTAGESFYGQDAQYDGNQPGYTLSADGLTVYDGVTGLTWTQSPDLDGDGDIDVDDKLTFAEAQIYADTLNAQNYGGYGDWRLPSMKELYSLIDFRGTDPMPTSTDTSQLTPFIDTETFDFAYGDIASGERIIDAQFWSSNTYVGTVFGNQTATFGLNLADGRIKGYPSSTGGPITKVNYVYFVRGNRDYGVNDFSDNGDRTITDNATGLMWSQDDSGDGVNTGPRSGMTWEEALDWVQQKNDENYSGYSDWRLPNAKELQSIVDYSRAPDATGSAAIDPVFNITQITNEAGEVDYPWFWTGTTHARFDGSGSAGVYISFGRAMGYMNGSWMDVHGAGAQRSDRKSGDFAGLTYEPDGYYFSQSPQGDAIRSYNYVRLVRDAETEVRPPGDYRLYLPLIMRSAVTPNRVTLPSSLRDAVRRVMASASTTCAHCVRGGVSSEILVGGDVEPIPGSGSMQPGSDIQAPEEAIAACNGGGEGDACEFTTPQGTITGTCLRIAGHLACVPGGGPPPERPPAADPPQGAQNAPETGAASVGGDLMLDFATTVQA